MPGSEPPSLRGVTYRVAVICSSTPPSLEVCNDSYRRSGVGDVSSTCLDRDLLTRDVDVRRGGAVEDELEGAAAELRVAVAIHRGRELEPGTVAGQRDRGEEAGPIGSRERDSV